MLAGRDPATVPIINLTPDKLALNLSVPRRLQAKWEIPPDVLESAAIVIDEKGQRTVKARRPSAGPSAALPGLLRASVIPSATRNLALH
jgi:hypothetical protein